MSNPGFSISSFDFEIDGLNIKDTVVSISGINLAIEKLMQSVAAKPGLIPATKKGRGVLDDFTVVRTLSDSKVFDWVKSCKMGGLEKLPGSLICYKDGGEKFLQVNFANLWPIAYNFPTLVSQGEGVSGQALEQFSLATEDIDLDF